jgi:hypothetical protein
MASTSLFKFANHTIFTHPFSKSFLDSKRFLEFTFQVKLFSISPDSELYPMASFERKFMKEKISEKVHPFYFIQLHEIHPSVHTTLIHKKIHSLINRLKSPIKNDELKTFRLQKKILLPFALQQLTIGRLMNQ